MKRKVIPEKNPITLQETRNEFNFVHLFGAVYYVMFVNVDWLKKKKEKGKQRLFVSFKPVAIISAELLLT